MPCPVRQTWQGRVTMVTPTNVWQTSLMHQDALLSLALMWPHDRPLQSIFDGYDRTAASAAGYHFSASLESQGTPLEIFVPLHSKMPLESIVSRKRATHPCRSRACKWLRVCRKFARAAALPPAKPALVMTGKPELRGSGQRS